jgi:hypothetical protein
MSLFMCMFGVIGVVTMATPDGANAVADFLRELTAEQNALAGAALSLLLLSVFAIALSTMSSLLSASLCTVCYDVLPAVWPELASAKGDDAGEATRRSAIAGGGLYAVTTIAGFFVADAYLQVNYTSGAFLALLFAFSCGTAPRSNERRLCNGVLRLGAGHSRLWRCRWADRGGDLSRDWKRAVAVGRGSRLSRIRPLAVRPGAAVAGADSSRHIMGAAQRRRAK